MAKAEQCSSGERGPVPLAWANWPAEMGTSLPQPSRPCPAAARTFSPSTTSNSTVSPSPTLRKNFLGLFLLMAVWQGKGHEKGEGGKPGVSLTPAGCATPISLCSPSVIRVARPEGGARPQAKFSGGEAAKQPKAAVSPRLCPRPVPGTLSLLPLPLRGFPRGGRKQACKQTQAQRRAKRQRGRTALRGWPGSSCPRQRHHLRGSLEARASPSLTASAALGWGRSGQGRGCCCCGDHALRTMHPRVPSLRPLPQNTA